jgi:hypothetical protein
MAGPCSPWVTSAEVLATPSAEGLDAGLVDEMILVAGEVLYSLSGQQYAGVCSDVVRPLQRWFALDGGQFGFPPGWQSWRNWWGVHSCGLPPSRAGGCGPLSEITLGAYPLREIIEVRIDGIVIDPTTYRIDDRRYLVRVDQTGETFPCCQNLAADPTVDVNTFQVAFEWGQAPPTSGRRACIRLATELAKAESGNPCNLPERVLNLQSQGISFALIDPQTFLDKSRVGIYLVDLFLAAVNPHGLRRRSTVISPDIPRPVRRTSTSPGS